jgi:hypothetical protein
MTAIAANSRTSRTNSVYTVLRVLTAVLISSGVLALIRHSRTSLQALPLSDLASVVFGYGFITLGLFALILSFHRSWAGRRLEPNPEAPPASTKEVGFIRLQSATLLLAGTLLLAPPLLAIYSASQSQARLAFVGIIIAFLAQTAVNLLIWRKADEFLRQTLSRISLICFWTLQGLLFVAAAAEKLQIIHGISLWDACIGMLTLYFLVSTALAIRTARA